MNGLVISSEATKTPCCTASLSSSLNGFTGIKRARGLLKRSLIASGSFAARRLKELLSVFSGRLALALFQSQSWLIAQSAQWSLGFGSLDGKK